MCTISFKFISQHYKDCSFIAFKYLVPIIKNQLTVTLQKFTIFTMLIHIRFERARHNWLQLPTLGTYLIQICITALQGL